MQLVSAACMVGRAQIDLYLDTGVVWLTPAPQVRPHGASPNEHDADRLRSCSPPAEAGPDRRPSRHLSAAGGHHHRGHVRRRRACQAQGAPGRPVPRAVRGGEADCLRPADLPGVQGSLAVRGGVWLGRPRRCWPPRTSLRMPLLSPARALDVGPRYSMWVCH